MDRNVNGHSGRDLPIDPGEFSNANIQYSPGARHGPFSGLAARAECVKLEEQVLITEDSVEWLTSFPFDERLLPREI